MNLSPSAELFVDHGETGTLLLGSVSAGFCCAVVVSIRTKGSSFLHIC